MSKTLGNVIDPNDLIEKYGTDALRYYMLRYISPFSDGDFSESKFKENYNSDLANGLGNLIARIAKLAEKIQFELSQDASDIDPSVIEKLKEYKLNDAINTIWANITELDKRINETEPWKLDEDNLRVFIVEAVTKIRSIAKSLAPFLPETSEKILQQYNGKITAQKPLFPRII